MDEQAGCYTEFLTEYPQYLSDIKYIHLGDSDEPEMIMTSTAMQAFIVWADAKGYVRKREKIPDMLNLLRRARPWT